MSDVEIRYCTDGVVAASVRDHHARLIADVAWTAGGGWRCSACPGRSCEHIAAVVDVTSKRREVA